MRLQSKFLAYASAANFFTVSTAIYMFVLNFGVLFAQQDLLFLAFIFHALAQLFISPILLKRVNNNNVRFVLASSLFFNAALLVLNYFCIQNFWVYSFVVSRFLAGATDVNLTVHRAEVVRINENVQKAFFTGMLNAMKYLGTIIGPIFFNISIVLCGHRHGVVFLLLASLYVLQATVTLRLFPKCLPQDESNKKEVADVVAERNKYGSYFALLMCIVFTVPVDALINYLPFSFAVIHDYHEYQISLSMTVMGIGCLLSNIFIAPRALKFWGVNVCLLIGALTVALSYASIFFLKSTNIYLLMLVAGLSTGFIGVNVIIKLASSYVGRIDSQISILSATRLLISSSLLLVFNKFHQSGINPVMYLFVISMLLFGWLCIEVYKDTKGSLRSFNPN